MPQLSEAAGLFQAFNPDAIPYVLAIIAGAFVLARALRSVMNSLSERMPKPLATVKAPDEMMSVARYALRPHS